MAAQRAHLHDSSCCVCARHNSSCVHGTCMGTYLKSVCAARARARVRSSRAPCPGSACRHPPAQRMHAHRRVGTGRRLPHAADPALRCAGDPRAHRAADHFAGKQARGCCRPRRRWRAHAGGQQARPLASGALRAEAPRAHGGLRGRLYPCVPADLKANTMRITSADTVRWLSPLHHVIFACSGGGS